ncbi:uncharacterized protein LOC122265539 [Penaeus japonicus]|uniref:uncharacterized protein LOC122265539 n=1 Tax=Penaeus japonicus TaxID=27405 RepID=UPI001C711E87|nr:uncharacterized protein LOC122265539 [Penaeus japonicus]
MRVSRNKNEMDNRNVVRMQDKEVKRWIILLYLGSALQNDGGCDRKARKEIQAGWNGLKRASGGICDKRISATLKGKACRVAVRPAMLYGLEAVSLTKRQDTEIEVAEMRMFRVSQGVMRTYKIRNEYIKGRTHVEQFGNKAREARLRSFVHVMRRDEELIGRRMLGKETTGREEERKAKEEFRGCSGRRYERNWSD